MSRAAPFVLRRTARPICGFSPGSAKPPSAGNMLLALDTATDTIGLALTDGARILAEEVWLARRHATVELAPETARLLRRTGAREDQLQGIAITIGPGSYTGLRIGLAFAKGLAFGRGLKVVPVPTLELLALGQPSRPEGQQL